MRPTVIALAIAALGMPSAALAQDAARGKELFVQCVACHSLEAGRNELGPSLHRLFGRKTASVDDYIYSPPMRRANAVWTPELLDTFLADPQSLPFRGNKMPFAGVPDPKARADIIAYLKEATQ